MERDRDTAVASRNLIVFERAPTAARTRIVGAVDEIARALQGRHVIDLAEAANDACVRLMFDAEKTSRKALVDAAGWLMPSLLRARRQPVSLMIAALFPMIYRELAKADDLPDLLKFVPFFDWDRCKTARRELVDAFMSSSWHAGDLALTASRCGDVALFLKRVVKSYGGEEYLVRIENDLGRLNDDGRRVIKSTIAEIRSDRSPSMLCSRRRVKTGIGVLAMVCAKRSFQPLSGRGIGKQYRSGASSWIVAGSPWWGCRRIRLGRRIGWLPICNNRGRSWCP